MEAPRSIRRRRPLVDCSNTVSRSSSSVKYVNPSLTSTLKRKSDQTMLKEKTKYVITSEASSIIASQSLSTNIEAVTRRMSSDLSSPASVLALPHTSRSGLGVGDKEFGEPVTDNMVRRKRNKDASSSTAAASLRLDLTSCSGKKTHQANEKKQKPLKVPPKKRQRTVKQEKEKSSDAATEEYIEQQRAYFAEIDAFELPEEEVSSGSDLD